MKIRLAILILTIYSSLSAQAKVKGRESGGGTSIAAEFVYVGKTGLALLADNTVLSLTNADERVRRTSVFDVQNLCNQDSNNGELTCLDARYNAISNKIEFDRNKWIEKTCEEKFVLASHEYLRAAGLEDSNYNYSNTFYGGGPGGAYLSEMKAVCAKLNASVPKHTSGASIAASSCQKDIKYLETALRDYDTTQSDADDSKRSYVDLLTNTLKNWMESYGFSCLPQAEEKCMEVCMPKAKALCFEACHFPG